MKTKNIWIALTAAFVLPATTVLATVFTNNAIIAVGDATYDGQSIVVSNCTLTVNGPHSFASLQVISNGVVTHTAAPNGEAGNLLSLTIAGDLGLDALSRIDVSGRGYAAGAGPGAGSHYSGGAGSGAGHGGLGGAPNYGGTGTIGGGYDSETTPNLWGSGGGDGGAGGGAIRLAVTGTLQLDGVIVADGSMSAGWTGGGGAGGSIQISAGKLAGGGLISAQGGSTDITGGGGGGGGRVALNLTVNSFAGTISAVGGLGYQNGGAGTIYTKLAGDTYGRVLVNNGGIIGAWTPMTNSEPFALVISNQARVYASTALTNQMLTVETNGLLSCMTGQSNVTLTVLGDVTVAAGGRIDVSSLGYTTGAGPGAGSYFSGGSGSGAGHGGTGGLPNYGGTGTVGGGYDSVFTPGMWGSGGGSGCCGGVGASGGGAIYLAITGTLRVDGVIAAEGASAVWPGGGGAGGSIQITAGNLAGGGSISAQGGSTDITGGGGGGGGRIALYLATNNFAGTVSAIGGLGYQNGGAGTIYTKLAADAYGKVLVDNGTNAGVTRLNSGLWPVGQVFNLTLSGNAIVKPDGSLTFLNLVLTNGAKLTHDAGQSNVAFTVLGDATVAASGRIDVSGQGYAAGAGPGAGTHYSGGSGSGAGHGGTGGAPNYGGTGALGAGYDSIFTPSLWGSGGGGGCCGVAGAGGGAINLVIAGSLQVDGVIAADGAAAGWSAGGGAGGSIQISAGTLAGGGSISAQGGSTDITGGGGGGGGRIALYFTTNNFVGAINAVGGLGYQNGGAGTIYTKLAADTYGKVLVDNGTNAGVTRLNSGLWPAGQVFNLTLSGNAIVKPDGSLTFLNLVLTNGANLTHDAGQSGFCVTALSNALIAANASINVDGLGYGSDTGPGTGSKCSSGAASGAGHGGIGQASYNFESPGRPPIVTAGGGIYGSATAPITLGSGGGGGGGWGGGAGGGAIQLTVAGTLQLDGTISANGLTGASFFGGGSGGSIWITADSLTGNGNISALGGVVSSYGAAGGGGRIAIYTYSKAEFDTSHISAAGAGTGTLVYGYPPPQPNTAVVGSALRLAWRAGNGSSYQVWSSPDLVNWSLYGPLQAGSGGILTLDCPMTNSPGLFFRVQMGN